MKPGIHKDVKVIGCYVGESPEKKTPYFSIEFLDTATNEYIDWTAWLSESSDKAVEAAKKNLETLMKLGFKGSSLSDMAKSVSIDQLFGEPFEPISLTIEEEEITDKDGKPVINTHSGLPKMRSVVKWVNVGTGGGLTKFDSAQAVVKFSSLRFDGDLAQIKANLGNKTPEPKKDVGVAGKAAEYKIPDANFATDDVPF